MIRFFRPLCVLISIVIACVTVSACGSDKAKKKKIEKSALKYVDEKYGFTPEVLNVTFKGGGDLVTKSQRQSGGIVSMRYNGRDFWVKVDLKEPDNNCDCYLRNDIEAEMTAYFKEKLKCEDIYCSYLYNYSNGQLKNVKSMADMLTCGKYDNISIEISTYGLDKANVSNIDASYFGKGAVICIADWTTKSEINNEITLGYTVMPEPEQGLKAYFCIKDGTVDMKEY